MSSFDRCPRCGWKALEKLRTHSYCVDCNYFETHAKVIDNDVSTPPPRKKKIPPEPGAQKWRPIMKDIVVLWNGESAA